VGVRIGQDRHRPEGDWVQTTMVEKVVGVHHRKRDARAFVEAVRRAESKGLIYGLQLEHQPNNPHDRNAIAVFGVAEVRGWFRRGMREWHVGFLDRDLAAELHRDLISKGLPIGAELYAIYVGDEGFIDINLIVLAPPGHGHKKRVE
jgi:hypothetical protein